MPSSRTPVGTLCSTTLPHCDTLVVPLTPLVRCLEAWIALPNPCRWLIGLCYSVRPVVSSVWFTSVADKDAPVLHVEIAVQLAKDTIEPDPPAAMKTILDLHVLNQALHKLPFKMLTQSRISECIRPQDWFAAIDL